jgi:hypothetical protein
MLDELLGRAALKDRIDELEAERVSKTDSKRSPTAAPTPSAPVKTPRNGSTDSKTGSPNWRTASSGPAATRAASTSAASSRSGATDSRKSSLVSTASTPTPRAR